MKRVEDILLRHRGKLLGFIRKRVSDPALAEDVLQEGLLKAIRSAGDLRDEQRLIPWFYQILQHAIIDTYRKRSVEAKYLEAYAREAEIEHQVVCDQVDPVAVVAVSLEEILRRRPVVALEVLPVVEAVVHHRLLLRPCDEAAGERALLLVREGPELLA